MKKILMSLCLVVALVTSTVGTFAEIDMSNLSLDELLSIQEQVNAAVEEAKNSSESADAQGTEISGLDASGYTELTKGSKGDEVKMHWYAYL